MANEPAHNPLGSDMDTAAHAILGLLDGAPGEAASGARFADASSAKGAPGEDTTESDYQPGDGMESDLAPHETASEEEEEPTDEGETEDPSIDPPKSWSNADKAKFNELPPDLQQVVLRRESERDKAITQRMQQIAEERKAVEAEITKVNHVQTQYAQTVNHLLSLTLPELQQVEQTNWQRLATEDPSEYVRLSAVRDGLRQRVLFMQSQIVEAQQQQQQHLLTAHQKFLAEQREQLTQHLPEFSDNVKRTALEKDIRSTLNSYGFTPEEINSVADARMVRVMARLAQLEKVEAARKSAQSKKSPAPAPRVMSPNASPVRESNKSTRMARQFDALKKSGSMTDARRLIEQML